MQGRKRLAIGFTIIAVLTGLVAAMSHFVFHRNADALWKIVSQQCIPGERQTGNPSPCSDVSEAMGYVILKDRQGVLQYLLLPTAKVSGIESPVLLRPVTPNYLAEAWLARRFMEERRGSAIDDSVYSLAVNSVLGRTQNQLHVHISCLYPAVRQQLDRLAPRLNDTWQTFPLKNHRYFLRTVSSDQLKRTSPFILIARELPDARNKMGHFGIAVAALKDGRKVLMVVERNLLDFNLASAEELQDHGCALLQQTQ